MKRQPETPRTIPATGAAKGESVGVRVTAEMKQLIEATADFTGYKASDLMREFVERWWPVFADEKRDEREQKLKRLAPLVAAQKRKVLKAGGPHNQ